MSKIICDVCGTRYPDSSEQCPICGCVRNVVTEPQEEPVFEEEIAAPAHQPVRGGRFSKANVRKRNRNQPIYEESEVPAGAAASVQNEDETDPYEEFEEANKRGGKVLNVLLAIVILALLAVSAYIFLEFFMPNFLGDESAAFVTEPVTETAAPATDAPTEAPTEAPNVACQQLVMEVTDITLHEPGEMFLLNVQALPEDTTDTIMYISSNEEVATVNEEGRVTAVGEGSVVISMFCGEQQTECNVICDFSEEETEAPEETAEAGQDATEAPAEGEDATEAPEETETEAPKAPEQLKDVTLSVKTSDLTFRSKGQQAAIKLTCNLENNEVTWSSENEAVATVSADGIITRIGAGTTKVIGQYGEQKVEIIVRCPKK